MVEHRTASNPLIWTSREGLAVNATREEWRPVPTWEGFYEVSNFGNVRSVDRLVTRIDGQRMRIKGRPLKSCIGSRGYPLVHLVSGQRSESPFVYRLVLRAFVGPRPEGMDGCHNDGDRLNSHADNLRWDTRSNNAFDKVRHGNHHWANRTHCNNGHEFSEENTLIISVKRKSGSTGRARRCRLCAQEANRLFYLRRKAGNRKQGQCETNRLRSLPGASEQNQSKVRKAIQ